MRRYIKHYYWFMRESYSFMAPRSKVWITLTGIKKAHRFARSMCKWDKMTDDQREAWYLSGEGRVLEI